LIAALVSDPLSALEPLQPPDAVQLVAFVELHVSVVVPPGATPGGFAVSCTDGDAPAAMFTVVRVTAPPPGPLQLNVKVVFADSAPLRSLPLTVRLPLQPPDAVQVSAFVVDHVSIVVPPDATLVGFADRLTVGGLWPPEP
jgi:hypothetical protein